MKRHEKFLFVSFVIVTDLLFCNFCNLCLEELMDAEFLSHLTFMSQCLVLCMSR